MDMGGLKSQMIFVDMATDTHYVFPAGMMWPTIPRVGELVVMGNEEDGEEQEAVHRDSERGAAKVGRTPIRSQDSRGSSSTCSASAAVPRRCVTWQICCTLTGAGCWPSLATSRSIS